MGLLSDIVGLAALGAGVYFTVYYIIPYMNYTSQGIASFQRQPAPAAPTPAPAPITPAAAEQPIVQDATLPTEEEGIEGLIEDTVEETLEEGGEEEGKDATAGADANKKQQERHDDTVAGMDPKKDTRTKEQLAAAQKKAGLIKYTSINFY